MNRLSIEKGFAFMALLMLLCVCLIGSALAKPKSFSSDPPAVSPCVKTLMVAESLTKNATAAIKTAEASCGTSSCQADLEKVSEIYGAISSVLLTNTTICSGVSGCENDPETLAHALGHSPSSSACADAPAVCSADLGKAALDLMEFVNSLEDDILLCCNSPACAKK